MGWKGGALVLWYDHGAARAQADPLGAFLVQLLEIHTYLMACRMRLNMI